MPTVINTNLASLFAQNSLSNAQNSLAQSVQRLSSGLRINSAKDDAAGLSISQNMQSQINGTNQSIRNLSDATNLLQTADSSLSTVQDMLLRLKQLATQGYDGSLSTSQKLNIVQEMKDLNNEINATAQRTTFNGIKLLTSGSSIDMNNSDIKSGIAQTTTAVSVATSGIMADGTLTHADTRTSTISVSLNPDLIAETPGTYTFTSNGNQLTMTGTFRGLAQSQTVTVQDAVANPTGQADRTTAQVLDFDTFGVKLNVNTTVTALAGTQLGSAIATTIAAEGASPNVGKLTVNGKGGIISDVRLSGTAPGTYQLSAASGAATGTLGSGLTIVGSAGITGTLTAQTAAATSFTTNGSGTGATLLVTNSTSAITALSISGGTGYKVGDTITIAATSITGGTGTSNTYTIGAITADAIALSGTINGIQTTQSVALVANAATASQTLNFDSFGVSFDVKSYQAQTASELTASILAQNSGTPSTAAQIVVAQGNNSALKFQSGANSDAFIQIDTLNVQTGTTGATAGSSAAMMTLGTRISQTGTGNLGTLGALDTIDTWQTAFKNAAAAVDNALEYISTERAVYGSQMNRLSYVSTNLQAQSTNLQNSRSAIIDTDFAAETAKLTKGQIMQQAATAMLAQANQMPNVILSLLK
jgi:flagellin